MLVRQWEEPTPQYIMIFWGGIYTGFQSAQIIFIANGDQPTTSKPNERAKPCPLLEKRKHLSNHYFKYKSSGSREEGYQSTSASHTQIIGLCFLVPTKAILSFISSKYANKSWAKLCHKQKGLEDDSPLSPQQGLSLIGIEPLLSNMEW